MIYDVRQLIRILIHCTHLYKNVYNLIKLFYVVTSECKYKVQNKFLFIHNFYTFIYHCCNPLSCNIYVHL